MKKYYYSDGKEQFGPFTFDELKEKALTNHTYVWHSGLDKWTRAPELKELRGIINEVPPPVSSIHESPPPLPSSDDDTPREKSRWHSLTTKVIVASLILLTVILIIVAGNFKTDDGEAELHDSTRKKDKGEYYEAPKPREPEVIKKELRETEKVNPLKFLKLTYAVQNRFLSKKEVISGSVKNNATLMSFGDIVVKVIYSGKDEKELKQEEKNLEITVGPQQEQEFKFKVEPPEGTEKIVLEIKSAAEA